MSHAKFNATREDSFLIAAIACRASHFARDPISTEMDITATHCNGCPLRLKDLLEADDSNFMHDVMGIAHNINRISGEIENHFLPRFHEKQPVETEDRLIREDGSDDDFIKAHGELMETMLTEEHGTASLKTEH